MSKLEGVELADHLVAEKDPAGGPEVMFVVKELITGTDDVVVEELGQYEHRHVVLNWTGTAYRNPANGKEYNLRINPANAVLRSYQERVRRSTGPLPRS